MITKKSPLANCCLLFLIAALILPVVIACGDGGDSPETDPYADWKVIQRENVKLYYVPGHPHEQSLPQLTEGYVSSLKTVCRSLSMPVPAETLLVYHYTGPGHGYEMTGARWPFVNDTIIHYWQPGYLGATLTEYVLTRFSPETTKHAIMWRGLQTVFDFSGINHNERVLNLLEMGRLPSLDSLVAMDHIDPQQNSRETAAAGSFVGFLHGAYGMAVIKQLYQSVLPFEEALVQITGRTLAQLEEEWHTALRRWGEQQRALDTLQSNVNN